jgi:D-tyrosyl-tRNA(Tyr) deacylase
MPAPGSYLLVLAEPDPVARAVGEVWGTPPATGEHLDGAAIRQLPSGPWLVRRPARHIEDDELDAHLPPGIRAAAPTLVFPSIHRSGQGIECLTVHPLGNPGPTAEVGGRPRELVQTDPRRMADALRRLAEAGARTGWRATYEATHHGPALGLPAFFAEIGYGDRPGPPPEAVRALADVLPALESSDQDRIALAVGGGHYAPHFTDLAQERCWAFGHILSRHVLSGLDRPTARRAYETTVGAEGLVAARADDLSLPALEGLGPRLRDREAPKRGPTAAASGT